MKIALAQINTKLGDIKYNFEKIIDFIQKAKLQKVDLIIFPYFSLIGGNIEKVVQKFPFLIKENKKYLEKITDYSENISILLSFTDDKSEKFALINQNKNLKIFNNEDIIKIENLKCKVFSSDNIFNYEKNNENFDIIINCAQNPNRGNQEQLKTSVFSVIAQKYNCPVIYVNNIGLGAEFSYIGISKVFDKTGNLIARANAFEEELLICNSFNEKSKISILPNQFENNYKKQEKFSLDYSEDLERIYKTLVFGIKEYFSKCSIKRAVLGLSGGLDSTVCAVVLADALGKENVFGVSMPSKITSEESKNDGKILAENLGINYTQQPIAPLVDTISKSMDELVNKVEQNWDNKFEQSFVIDNIQARSRAVLLWGISNAFKSCIPIAISDKSEAYMGYATVNGDMSGGFAPIADITKTKLFALARWMNKNRKEKNVIPESVILKPPGAELVINPKTGKTLTAEEALMPYEFLDEVIWRIENNAETYYQMLNSQFVYETKHNLTKELKEEWLDKFFRRMSNALYKWTLMPPSIIIDNYSINKAEYSQPVLTNGINYKV